MKVKKSKRRMTGASLESPLHFGNSCFKLRILTMCQCRSRYHSLCPKEKANKVAKKATRGVYFLRGNHLTTTTTGIDK